MEECNACGAYIRPGSKACPACKAPVNRTNGKQYRDPNHGKCEYNDHGIRCGMAGSIALHTGSGGPWYCSQHALGLRGMSKKSTCAQSLKERLMAIDFDEAKREREAIQEESAI